MDRQTISAFSPRTTCRSCGSADLRGAVDLGIQCLTGVFPDTNDAKIPSGPLKLNRCDVCELVQLSVDYDPGLMYGNNYGYRSGLNSSMVAHLSRTADILRSQEPPGLERLVILDIGSNDGTFLSNFPADRYIRVGIDPTSAKFIDHYEPNDLVVSDLFSEAAFRSVSSRNADLIASISMFYDLPDPVRFAREVGNCLQPNGLWLLEQSYLPAMLNNDSYDTICHEHTEYYSLASISRVLETANLKVVDVLFNDVNGGSFCLLVSHQSSERDVSPRVAEAMTWERESGSSSYEALAQFQERIDERRERLIALIRALNRDGRTVAGLGASTKGNVLLQYCGLGVADIKFIGDLNPYKWGRFTPGSAIPIVPELEMRALRPDYLLVLPWHFRQGILERESDYLKGGGRLIFPLPNLEVIGS